MDGGKSQSNHKQDETTWKVYELPRSLVADLKLQNSLKPIYIRHIGEYLSQHTTWHRCKLHVTRQVWNVHVCISAVETCHFESSKGNHIAAVRLFQVCPKTLIRCFTCTVQEFLLHWGLYDNKTRSCCRGSPECSAGVHLSDLHLYWLLNYGVSYLRNMLSTFCLSLCRAEVSSCVSVLPVPSPLNEKYCADPWSSSTLCKLKRRLKLLCWTLRCFLDDLLAAFGAPTIAWWKCQVSP